MGVKIKTCMLTEEKIVSKVASCTIGLCNFRVLILKNWCDVSTVRGDIADFTLTPAVGVERGAFFGGVGRQIRVVLSILPEVLYM